MKRLLVNDKKSMGVLIASLLMLPIVSSCASQTAQAPTVAATSPVSSPTPQAGGTIVEVAAANPALKNLTAALQAGGLTETLKGQGPFTIFAPTDQAFSVVPAALRQRLLQPQNRKTLTRILSYHVVPGKLSSSQLNGAIKTLEGQTLTVQTGGQVTVNDAKVTQPDIQASNGVIHLIDRIIVPPDVKL